MTNREIKFELAKIALTKCNFLTSETLTQGLKNIYEWIVEEPEVEEETINKYGLDSIDIREVLNIVRKDERFSIGGIATSLETIFNKNNINTVGDLMRIGRRDFYKYKLVGKKSVWAIDEALDKLGFKGW